MLQPPGFVDDFERRPALKTAFAEGWGAWLGRSLDDSAAFAAREGGRFRRPHARDSVPQAAIAWDAFPKALTKWYEGDAQADELRWRTAEVLRPVPYGRTPSRKVVWAQHRQQDEYCEWFVRRDGDGRIVQVDFTTEGPEYWLFLAHGTKVLYRDLGEPPPFGFDGDLSLVVELYREYVNDQITEADLVWPTDVKVRGGGGMWQLRHKKGEYNPFNRWNTTHGAMHLTHPASTLAAEIRLAADGTVVRSRAGRPVTDPDDLICCSGYGDPNRSSDPTIGASVNGLAQAGHAIALADPIGLYMSELDLDAFVGPGDADVSDAWALDRGAGNRILRAHFGRSRQAGADVEAILAQGHPIRYGGQIADAIQMVLVGEAGKKAAPSRGRPCATRCCKRPGRKPVKAIVDRGVKCTDVDWPSVAPYTGADDEERQGERSAEELDDAEFVSSATTRAGYGHVRL
jgi:hypothetical protein